VYYNTAIQDSFTITCPENYHPEPGYVIYEVPSGKFTSTISQEDADAKALLDLQTNGPIYASENIQCVENDHWYNVQTCGTFTKNDCPANYHGSQVQYCVASGTYKSYVSQADADAMAQANVNANGQTYANTNGQCIEDTKYCNVELTANIARNDCQANYSGTQGTVKVPAGLYCSYTSQAAANTLAQTDLDTNKQAIINEQTVSNSEVVIVTPSTCQENQKWGNAAQSGQFTRNNCTPPMVGSTVTLTVPANTFFSYVSQADANQQALDYLNANGQGVANGTISLPTLGSAGVCQAPQIETDIQVGLDTTAASNEVWVDGNTGDKFYVTQGFDVATQSGGTTTEYTFASPVKVTLTNASVRIFDYSSTIKKVRFTADGNSTDSGSAATIATINRISRVKSLINIDVKKLFMNQNQVTVQTTLTGAGGSQSKLELAEVTGLDNFFNGCNQMGDTRTKLWFDNLTKCTSFAGLFANIENRTFRSNTDFDENNGALQIDLNIFRYNIALISINAIFENTRLVEIPTGSARIGGAKGNVSIFDTCTKIMDFTAAFNCNDTWLSHVNRKRGILPAIPEYLYWYNNPNTAGGGIFANNYGFAGQQSLPANVPYLWDDTIDPNAAIGAYDRQIWFMFCNCTTIVNAPADLFRPLGYKTGNDALSGGISGVFEGCTSMTQIPGTIFHANSNNKHNNGTFVRAGITSLPYNLLWANRQNMNAISSFISNTPTSGWEVPNCFLRVMKRDGSIGQAGFRKDLTLPYYDASQNAYWDANGKHAGTPSGQYVTDDDLLPMLFDIESNRPSGDANINETYINGQLMGFINTFYNAGCTFLPNVFEGVVAGNFASAWELPSKGAIGVVPANLLGKQSIADNVVITRRMFMNRILPYDVQASLPASAYPNLRDTRNMFENCSEMTGNAIPLITGKLSGVAQKTGTFFGCTGLSDYATIFANYQDWVTNAYWAGNRSLWGISPNYPANPIYRVKIGSGYLRGVAWIDPGSTYQSNKDFWTYLEDVPASFAWNGALFWQLLPFAGSALTQSQVETAMQGAFGTAFKGTFTSYAAMVAAFPQAADTVNAEILF
jgi:hypothetical protein